MGERIIQHYEVLPAGIRPYDPRAADVARRVTELVHTQLPHVRIEHIGSTSVPGCAGKGYIDLMILFNGDDELAAIKGVLEELGFQRQATKVAFPESRPMRTGVIEHEGSRFRLHVHVVPADSTEVDDLLLFRDQLRADPSLMAAYVARKREILESGITESPDYALAKGGFVHGALRAAKPED